MPVLSELMDDVSRARDEVSLQLHLASMDARQEFEALEEKWKRLAAEARLHESSEKVEQDLHDLAQSLSEGYGRIRKALSAGREND